MEFDHVFTLYLGSGHFPDRRGDPEEERRLLYVAVTRARLRAYICGEPGASPDLFDETNVAAALPTLSEVEHLADVIASGYDPWQDYSDNDGDLDWDEATEEETDA